MTRAKLVYWGHHKCASTWITRILHTVAWRAGWQIGKHETWHDGARDSLEASLKSVDLIISPNSRKIDADVCSGVPGFHVIRDPRDLIVSAYFSHKNTHPLKDWFRLEAQRRRLQGMTKEEGLVSTMDFIKSVFTSMRDWRYNQPNVIELKMEDLTRDPYQGFLDLFERLDLVHDPLGRRPIDPVLNRIRARTMRLGKYPARWLIQDVHTHRYKQLSGGRKPGEEDKTSHYRKGKPGDWRNHWSDHVQSEYHQRFGRLHEALGYAP